MFSNFYTYLTHTVIATYSDLITLSSNQGNLVTQFDSTRYSQGVTAEIIWTTFYVVSITVIGLIFLYALYSKANQLKNTFLNSNK